MSVAYSSKHILPQPTDRVWEDYANRRFCWMVGNVEHHVRKEDVMGAYELKYIRSLISKHFPENNMASEISLGAQITAMPNGWKLITPDGRECMLQNISVSMPFDGYPEVNIRGIVPDKLLPVLSNAPATSPMPELKLTDEQALNIVKYSKSPDDCKKALRYLSATRTVAENSQKIISGGTRGVTPKSTPKNTRTERVHREQDMVQQNVIRHMLFAILFALTCHYCYITQPLDKAVFWAVDKWWTEPAYSIFDGMSMSATNVVYSPTAPQVFATNLVATSGITLNDGTTITNISATVQFWSNVATNYYATAPASNNVVTITKDGEYRVSAKIINMETTNNVDLVPSTN